MKKRFSVKKRFIAAGFLAIMVVGTSIPVSAAEVCYCIRNGQAAGVVWYSCNKAKLKGTDYTHTYGFLWDSKTCTITPYLSKTREYCNKCNFTYGWYGPHECEVSHNSCGKGRVDVCTVMGLLPGDKLKLAGNNAETE